MPLVGKCAMAYYVMPAAALVCHGQRSASMILKLHYFESALPTRASGL